MASFLTAFNNLVIRFNDELISIFPEETEFKKIKTAIELVKQTNPRLLMTVFVTSIAPWVEHIKNRNEDFFMNKDYTEEVEGDDNFLRLITRLKQYWPNLGDNNKNAIWKYLDTLIVLSGKCMTQ